MGFGAQRTVSRSLHVLEAAGSRYLIDVGVFMGEEGANAPWPSDVPPRSIEGVVITHAHADHLGRLPLLLKKGYDDPVFMTGPTYDLARIALAQNVALTNMGEERFYYSRHNEGERAHPRLPPGLRVRPVHRDIPGSSVQLLRESGWDVEWVAEERPGMGDEEVLKRARQGHRLHSPKRCDGNSRDDLKTVRITTASASRRYTIR